MEKKLNNVEDEKCTLQDLEFGEKPEKSEKMRNVHFMTWIMEKKLKHVENEKSTFQDLVKKAHSRTWLWREN